jgi:carboxymethylenebutenolidase
MISMRKTLLIPLLLFFVSCISAPPSIDRLNASPRHQEWVEVRNGDKTIYTWVVYPEMSMKRPVVILIHENRGLSDWVRGMADQVAEAGYIAVAPDLLSEFSETEKRTSDFADEDAARNAIAELDPEDVQADLQAVAEWAKMIPAGNGKLVSAGFCWGGAQSFQFAAGSDDLAAAMVFYGTGPEEEAAYANIAAPVFGFYGGDDARVNATIEESGEYMTAAGKKYDYVIYDGAGHAFMRLGEDPSGDPANVAARNAAWERMKMILEGL